MKRPLQLDSDKKDSGKKRKTSKSLESSQDAQNEDSQTKAGDTLGSEEIRDLVERLRTDPHLSKFGTHPRKMEEQASPTTEKLKDQKMRNLEARLHPLEKQTARKPPRTTGTSSKTSTNTKKKGQQETDLDVSGPSPVLSVGENDGDKNSEKKQSPQNTQDIVEIVEEEEEEEEDFLPATQAPDVKNATDDKGVKNITGANDVKDAKAIDVDNEEERPRTKNRKGKKKTKSQPQKKKRVIWSEEDLERLDTLLRRQITITDMVERYFPGSKSRVYNKIWNMRTKEIAKNKERADKGLPPLSPEESPALSYKHIVSKGTTNPPSVSYEEKESSCPTPKKKSKIRIKTNPPVSDSQVRTLGEGLIEEVYSSDTSSSAEYISGEESSGDSSEQMVQSKSTQSTKKEKNKNRDNLEDDPLLDVSYMFQTPASVQPSQNSPTRCDSKQDHQTTQKVPVSPKNSQHTPKLGTSEDSKTTKKDTEGALKKVHFAEDATTYKDVETEDATNKDATMHEEEISESTRTETPEPASTCTETPEPTSTCTETPEPASTYTETPEPAETRKFPIAQETPIIAREEEKGISTTEGIARIGPLFVYTGTFANKWYFTYKKIPGADIQIESQPKRITLTWNYDIPSSVEDSVHYGLEDAVHYGLFFAGIGVNLMNEIIVPLIEKGSGDIVPPRSLDLTKAVRVSKGGWKVFVYEFAQ